MPKFCKSAKNAFKASEDFIVSCLCHDDQKTLLISILQHDSLKRGEVNNSKSPAKNRTPSVTMHMICLCLILWEIIKYPQLSNISVKSVTWSCIFFLFCHFRMNFATHLLLVCRAVLCCVVLCFLVCFTHHRGCSPFQQSAQLVETFLSLSRFSLAFSLIPVLTICTNVKVRGSLNLIQGQQTNRESNQSSKLPQ